MMMAMALALALAFVKGGFTPHGRRFFRFLLRGVGSLAEAPSLFSVRWPCSCYCCRLFVSSLTQPLSLSAFAALRCHLHTPVYWRNISCPGRIILVSLSRGAAYTTCCLCCKSQLPPSILRDNGVVVRLFDFRDGGGGIIF